MTQVGPNIAAGFKNNIGPNVDVVPVPSVVTAPALDIVGVTDIELYNIFGFELQKKYFYIIVLLVLGIAAYFVWKWWYGPKKSKKSKRQHEDNDEDDEENDVDDKEDDEENESDVYIPQYSSKSEKKGKDKKSGKEE